MSTFWIFKMGRSAANHCPPPHQTIWKWCMEATRPGNWLQRNAEGTAPLEVLTGASTCWVKVESADPNGYATSITPTSDWLVGTYGNWWGAQWSGKIWTKYDGMGPVTTTYINPLDEIARDHDIECWLSCARNQAPSRMRVGDDVIVEDVWDSGGLHRRRYAVQTFWQPHETAKARVRKLDRSLKIKLFIAVVRSYKPEHLPLTDNAVLDTALALTQELPSFKLFSQTAVSHLRALVFDFLELNKLDLEPAVVSRYLGPEE